MIVVYYVFVYPCFLATKSLYGSCQPCAKIFRPNVKPQVHGFVAWNINVEESMRKAAIDSPGYRSEPLAQVDASVALLQSYHATLKQQFGNMTQLSGGSGSRICKEGSSQNVQEALAGTRILHQGIQPLAEGRAVVGRAFSFFL